MRDMCTSLLIAVMFYGKIAVASISAEGAACAAMAIAMPQLTRLTGAPSKRITDTSGLSPFIRIITTLTTHSLGLSPGKTMWSTTPGTWDPSIIVSTRDIIGDITLFDHDEVSSVHRTLYTTQPSWCSFQGVTCGTVSGTALYASVLSIDLSSYSLKGSLPSSIGNFGNLTVLNLSSNSISGMIPTTIGDLTSLKSLDLGYNFLTGTIPSTIAALTALENLIANSNQLTANADMPLFDSALKTLKTINLESNNFFGTIPTEIGDFNSLTRFSMGLNRLIGTIPDTISKLSGLVFLSLQGTSLSGTIPAGISKLLLLTKMDLSSAFLTGTIPSGMSALTILKILDLHDNYLTMGAEKFIPSSRFSAATYRGALDLSLNCLQFTYYDMTVISPTQCPPLIAPISKSITK